MYFDLQRASMLKRISAWILDAIVVSILATGFGFLVSSVIGYDARYSELNDRYMMYENKYMIRMDVTEEDYEAMDAEEYSRYEQAYDAMTSDEVLNYQYTLVMNMTLVIISLGILLAYILNDLVVPLILKDGQTLGKKIFGICLMQTDHTKLRPVSLAVRTILGKYTIETMIPVFIIMMIFFGFIGITGTVIIGILLLIQLAVLIYTQTNSCIHDLLAMTVAVDAKSQMIFENKEAMEEYAKKTEEYNKKEKGLI